MISKGFDNIIEEFKRWKIGMNEILQGTLESEFWPLWFTAPKEISLTFMSLSYILMIAKEVLNLKVSKDNASSEKYLTFYLVLAFILNCSIFINTLVFGNCKTMMITVIKWLLGNMKLSEDWILNVSILVSLFKCLELVNNGIMEGIEMKNKGMEKRHYISLIAFGFMPINSWIGHAFYNESGSNALIYSTMNKAASTISSCITIVKLIELIGRQWTYTLEVLTFISLAIKVVQLSIVVAHAVILYCNQDQFASAEKSAISEQFCEWLLFFSFSCLGIITCKGNDQLRLIGVYSPLIIVFTMIYSWDHITRIGMQFRKKKAKTQ